MFFKKKPKEAQPTPEEQQRALESISQVAKEYGVSSIRKCFYVHDHLGNSATINKECLWIVGPRNGRLANKMVVDKDGFIEAYKTWILPLIESGELK